MSDSAAWEPVLTTDVTGRHFTMEESGNRTEGTMKPFVVDEAAGYVTFVDSNDNEIAGCTLDHGSAYFLSDGRICVNMPYLGALTIAAD